MSSPNLFDPDFTPAEGNMLILTTIYFTELRELAAEDAQQETFPLQPSAAESHELVRELLSLYEGRNRVLPIDRNG